MKVLFLTSTFPRFSGDTQAPFVLEQAQAWKAKRPEDRVIVLAPHHAGAAHHETIGDVEIERFRYFVPEGWQQLAYPAILPNLKRNPLLAIQILPFLICAYKAARRIIRVEQIDLVYAHWVMPQGVVAWWLKRATDVPYVLQNHSSDMTVFTRFGRPGRALAKSILDGATAFFCVNAHQQTFAYSIVPELKCHVLPMGVSLAANKKPTTKSRSSYRYLIGSISRLSKKKGIAPLISAAETLARRGRIIPVGIAGDGEDADELKRRPKQADIKFTGFVSGQEKKAFFDDCFAMAFPSVNSGDDVEGMPVALLEAMIAGKPIIASRATNIELLPEWPAIEDAVELLEDVSDSEAFAKAILRVTELTPEQVKKRAAQLHAAISRYAWDRLIEEYLDIIQSALASGKNDQFEMLQGTPS